MTDPDHDIWRELEASVDRDGARLEPRFGNCPVCSRGASAAISIGPIVWSVCRLCGTRWHAGDDLLERVEDDELLGPLLESLATFAEIRTPGIPPISKNRGDGMKTKETKQNYQIDPHQFLTPKEARILPGLTAQQRVRLTDLVLADLREHPLTRRNRATGKLMPDAHVWDRIRAAEIDDSGRKVDQILCFNPEIQAPSLTLTKLVQLLLDVRERRAALVKQLADLEIVEAAVAESDTLEPVAP